MWSLRSHCLVSVFWQTWVGRPWIKPPGKAEVRQEVYLSRGIRIGLQGQSHHSKDNPRHLQSLWAMLSSLKCTDLDVYNGSLFQSLPQPPPFPKEYRTLTALVADGILPHFTLSRALWRGHYCSYRSVMTTLILKKGWGGQEPVVKLLPDTGLDSGCLDDSAALSGLGLTGSLGSLVPTGFSFLGQSGVGVFLQSL